MKENDPKKALQAIIDATGALIPSAFEELWEEVSPRFNRGMHFTAEKLQSVNRGRRDLFEVIVSGQAREREIDGFSKLYNRMESMEAAHMNFVNFIRQYARHYILDKGQNTEAMQDLKVMCGFLKETFGLEISAEDMIKKCEKSADGMRKYLHSTSKAGAER